MNNSFSLIIPAYKEEKFIEETLRNFILACRKNSFDFELITVIDNVIDDKTLEIVKKLSKDHSEIVIVSREQKQGIASAIKDGINAAKKDVIIITVAGKHVNPSDIILMAKKMNENYDMVFGDRFTKGLRISKYPKSKLIANRLCNAVISILFGINAKDITSGVKAYKTPLLKNLKFNSIGFEIFVEIPVTVFLNGSSNFAVVPLTHHERDIMYSHFNLMTEWPRYFKTIVKLFLFKIKKYSSNIFD
jgi:glycosyltransferase involved in cell wall biosynthesis|tara:strand:+ start:403 stop:1143 length:741 start_codon:yes stop_codon:yes gene_type:complete